MDRIEELTQEVDREIEILRRRLSVKAPAETEFDLRGDLYGIALRIAPKSRADDLALFYEWLRPHQSEVAVDFAAGGGFLSRAIAQWTDGTVYAVDPSEVQLKQLRGDSRILPLCCSWSDSSIEQLIPASHVDFVASIGGFHHVHNHRALMLNVDRILKSSGRMVVADVRRGSALANHFDQFVRRYCLTGHEGTWSDEAYLTELLQGTSLRLRRASVLPHIWKFSSDTEMALFFKALHALDISLNEIVKNLELHLGVHRRNESVHLNWPMFFFEIVKEA